MYMSEKFLKKRCGSVDNDETLQSDLYQIPPGGSPEFVQSNNYKCSVDNARFIGWDIPHFHRRVKKGELLPHTPWWRQTLTGDSIGSSDYNYCDPSVPTDIWNIYRTGNFSPLDDWCITADEILAEIPSRYDQYLMEAAAKIYSSGHDTLTFLAEMTEVRRLFLSTSEKLVTIVKSLRRRKPSKIRWDAYLKSRSNEWLSVRYGWRTLKYDLEDLYKVITHLGEKRTRYSETSGNKVTNSTQNDYEYEKWLFYLDCVQKNDITVEIRGSVTADIDIPQFQFNPFVTAWELIPLSFVIDWICSIGKSIAAMSFKVLEHNYVASKGYQVTYDRTFQSSIGTLKTGCNPVFTSGTQTQYGWSKFIIEKRTPCTVPFIPHYALRLNPYKVIDLLGLLIQRK